MEAPSSSMVSLPKEVAPNIRGGGEPTLAARTLCDPMDCSPTGKNTGVYCHFLLQEIFPTQGSNPRLLRHMWILYH